MKTHQADWITGIVRFFVNSKLTPLLILVSILLGAFAVLNLPREEEPQIVVPLFDIFVPFPGASAEEIEQRILNLGERKLWEIPGVEYIYSTAETNQALIMVRFHVGEDMEESLIKLYTKVYSNLDFLPQGASEPLIKSRSIDDVPILTLTFYSPTKTPLEVRKAVARLRQEINAIPDISETNIIGGRKRQFQVFFNEEKLKDRLLSPLEIAELIRSANIRLPAHHLEAGDNLTLVEANSFFRSKRDLENLVVGISAGNVVYLRDVAEVVDGPDEEERLVNVRFGPASKVDSKGPFDAVTLTVAKRKGTNATVLAETILEKAEDLRGKIIPEDIQMVVTRNYGETAKEKSDELLFHMAIAVFGVSLLIAWALGWRESGVVAIAIPMTLALTLAVFYFAGFTLNRSTLFALILSIGILVDDPIVDVENIVRHLRLPENKGRPLLEVTIEAVNEVRSPLILATIMVIAAVLPIAFVRGLMGPYMRPIPIGASTAMAFSMVVAFVATPWSAYQILSRALVKGKLKGHGLEEKEDLLTRFYRAYMGPLIYRPKVWRAFLIVLSALMVLSVLLVPFKLVRMKMLPFDNKNEFQIVLNMPEGTPLERTRGVLEEIAAYVTTIPEVQDIEMYAGTSAPYNFNGLVRHYFLRSEPWQGDLQVNLVNKHKRKRQSHEIAESVRPRIHEIVAKAGGHIQVAEVPPGPPVLSTLVVEVYGPNQEGQIQLARRIEELLSRTKGITDVDTYVQSPHSLSRLNIDSEKASLNGIPVAGIANTISAALAGLVVDLAHLAEEHEPVEIILRLPKSKRETEESVLGIHLLSRFGRQIAIRDLVQDESRLQDQPVYHKNLMPVSYVVADVTGAMSNPIYAILHLRKEIDKLRLPDEAGQKKIRQYFTHLPPTSEEWAIKWDGEWHITYEVFRDLGMAFAAVLILIYILVVGWFKSFKTPLAIMLPIPLTLIGILPAHAMLNWFFTATSMIGMIAGAGIVVRNSIILVDFAELRLAQGIPLEEAVIDAGTKRFRPMLLTASAVIVGSAVILFDPIFQGLALSLMAGEIASTVLARTAVPVIYYSMMKKKGAVAAGVDQPVQGRG